MAGIRVTLDEFKELLGEDLQAFCSNIKSQKGISLKQFVQGNLYGEKFDAATAVTRAFTWSETPQGRKYWESLYNDLGG